MSDQPTPQQSHIDTYAAGAAGARRKGSRMATLSSKQREKLSDSDFALPGRRYPIHDIEHARNALARVAQNGSSDEQSKVKAAVGRRYPNLKKTDLLVGIWKSESQQIVYGVVLEPNLEDSQGDVVGPAEIEKAAHRYLAESRKSDVQHDEVPAGVELIESYVAPHDMIVAGQAVTKGSWVLAHKITDAGLWDQVQKGELTGYSIGGTGVRVPDDED